MERTDPPPFFWPEGAPGEPTPIPELLHSTYEGGPFRTCTICSEPLEDGRLYEIEKVFRGREPVFEMAICLQCGIELAAEFSRESTQAIRGFLEERLTITRGDAVCHACGRPTSEARGRTVSAISCRGFLLGPLIVICDACEEAIQALLSEKTRRVQGDFIETHFPGVPEGLDVSPRVFFG